MKKIYGLLAFLCVVTACASDPDMDDWSAEQIYNKAFDDLEATKYKKAAEEFEKVETEHPYSKWAVKSKLMSAFAYYKNEKYDDAVIAADRFLKYHPGNKDAAYALYLKGICYYDQISAADKDQGDTQKAEEAFQYLIALFPNTPYAEDARQKINLTEDYKAGQEMIIGRFYLNEGNYLSALNRFNVVLENYQTTIQIEEALYREVEIYAILGMNQYANGYYKILQENYPNGKWTAKAAKIMQKIGVHDKVETQNVMTRVNKETENEPETNSSWFGGWWGNSNDETAADVATTKPETSSSWFGGWWGNSNDETSAEVVTTEPETDSSWFRGWFGGQKEISAEPRESWYSKWKRQKADEQAMNAYAEDKPATSSSWFNGWFGGDDSVSETVVEAPFDTREPVASSSSWFSGWFGGNDTPEAVVETPVVAKELTPSSSSSWFSGWFGSDSASEAVIESPIDTREPAASSSSWFDGWFGGNDTPEAVVETPVISSDLRPEKDFSYNGGENRVVVASKEESKSWFNWFDDNLSGN